MNKKITFLFSLITLLLTSSCSSDSDSNLEPPKYEQDAALYNITAGNSPYSSIELTASGNYIIIDKYNSRYSLSKKKFIKPNNAVTRSSSTGIIYGTYTKSGENTYNLAGFGRIRVVNAGGNSVDLDITTTSGKSITIGANRANINSSSDMTVKLCRTWAFEKVHYIEWIDGTKTEDFTASIKDFISGNYVDADEFEFPKEVIFTKAGTYLVTYYDGTLAISTWKWEDESKGIIRYSWDYEHIYDPDESGIVNVKFKGSGCVFTEDYTEISAGAKWREYTEWTMKEVR